MRIANFSIPYDTSMDQTPEFLELMQKLEPRSALLTPVVFRGELFGLLAFVNARRNFDAEDEAIAEELHRRAGVALENARLYEEAVAEREAAERAKSMRDKVLSIVAHDLGSPLNAIGLWADVIFRAAPHESRGRIHEGQRREDRGCVRRMNALLRYFLDAASIDAVTSRSRSGKRRRTIS